MTTEAMTNVVRHAGASQCSVEVTADDDELVLLIRDNGHGLQPERSEGIGMNSMRERVAEIGGLLTVASDESGTSVLARLPLT